MRIIPNSFKFRTTTLIKILVVLLMSKGVYSMLLGASFDKSSATNHNLEVYDTINRGDEPCSQCALMCLWKRTASVPSCHAYSCDPQDGTCDFYMTSTTQVSLPGVEMFLLQGADVFHTISVGGNLFSIYLSSTTMSYHNARTHCQSLGGYLLEFDSLEELDAVRIVGGGEFKDAIIGANDIASEGQWVMDRDGGAPINMDVWTWSVGEPSNTNGNEDCSRYYIYTDSFNDLPCDFPSYVLCERDIL